jgi:hypothetical protein
MLTIIPRDTGGQVTKNQGKRGDVIGARFNDVERARWDKIMEIVVERNPLARSSDVLRDFLFGTLRLVTNNERSYLYTGDESYLSRQSEKRDMQAKPFYPVLDIRDASDISGELGIDINIVTDVVAGLTDGKDPQMVKAILDASKKQTDKVTPINSKLASG